MTDQSLTSPVAVAAVDVPTCDVARPTACAAAFYRAAIPALVRRHRLHRAEPRSYRAVHVPTQAQYAGWARLFGVAADADIPFTCSNTSATLMLMRVLADHGVNFRFVRHLRTELDFPETRCRPGRDYALASHVADIIPLRSDRVAIVTVTATLGPDGRPIASQRDFWAVMAVHPDDAARAATGLARNKLAELQGLKRQKTRLDAAAPVPIPVPRRMGIDYGWLSGDLNPTHLSNVAARLFGNPRAFIQGFCTVNLVIAAAHRLGIELKSLSMTFVRPVFVDQTIHLRSDAGSFEVCDAASTLLASGRWGLRA